MLKSTVLLCTLFLVACTSADLKTQTTHASVTRLPAANTQWPQAPLTDRVCSTVKPMSAEDIYKSFWSIAREHTFWPNSDTVVAMNEGVALGGLTHAQVLAAYKEIFKDMFFPPLTAISGGRAIRTAIYSGQTPAQVYDQLKQLKKVQKIFPPDDTIALLVETAALSNLPIARVHSDFAWYFTQQKTWAPNESPARLVQIGILLNRDKSEIYPLLRKMASFQKIWNPTDSITELAITSLLTGKSPEDIYSLFHSIYDKQSSWSPSESVTELTKTAAITGLNADQIYDLFQQIGHKQSLWNPDVRIGDLVRISLLAHSSPDEVYDAFRQLFSSQTTWGDGQDVVSLTRQYEYTRLNAAECHKLVSLDILLRSHNSDRPDSN